MLPPFEQPIYITRPIMPDNEELDNKIEELYQSRMLTNLGPNHEKLEMSLQDYLKVSHLYLFNNATIGLITALKALELPFGSEVITTPFTFAATPHSIVWNGLKPMFCDIEPTTMTIDPIRIEALITPHTSAILGVHVYGFPCDVHQISKIAQKYNLHVMYDGAHAFTTEIDQKSICEFGDITVLSFHATKLFHTLEGGALVFKNPSYQKKIKNLRNFGIQDEFTVTDIGINGKLNEIQAIFGLLNLELVHEEQKRRKIIRDIYKKRLAQITAIDIPEKPENCSDSYQYFPILIKGYRDQVYNSLRRNNIFARKYFFPPCTEYDCYKGMGDRITLPVTYRVADQVLCLPFYGELGVNKTNIICDVIIDTLNKVS